MSTRGRKVKEFFTLLFPSSHGWVEIRAIKGREVKQYFYRPGEIPIKKLLRLSKKKWDVYFGVCARKKKKGKAKDVLYSTVLWVDIDGSKTALERFRPSPSIIISSGHGFHAYWVLSHVYKFSSETLKTKFMNKLKQLALLTNGDLAATDLARVLRVPYTINWKGDKDEKEM